MSVPTSTHVTPAVDAAMETLIIATQLRWIEARNGAQVVETAPRMAEVAPGIA